MVRGSVNSVKKTYKQKHTYNLLYCEKIHIANKPRTERPTILKEREEKTLIRRVQKDPSNPGLTSMIVTQLNKVHPE